MKIKNITIGYVTKTIDSRGNVLSVEPNSITKPEIVELDENNEEAFNNYMAQLSEINRIRFEKAIENFPKGQNTTSYNELLVIDSKILQDKLINNNLHSGDELEFEKRRNPH